MENQSNPQLTIPFAGIEIPWNFGVFEKYSSKNKIPRYKIYNSDKAEGMKKDMQSHLSHLNNLYARNKNLKYCRYLFEGLEESDRKTFETKDSTLDGKLFWLMRILYQVDEETVAGYARDAANDFSDFALEAITSQDSSMLKSVGPVDPRTMRIYDIFLSNWENRNKKPFDSRRFQLECKLLDGGYCSALQSQRDKERHQTKELILKYSKDIQSAQEALLNGYIPSSERKKVEEGLIKIHNKLKKLVD